MIVRKLEIERFRMLHNQAFELGSSITAIVGQNGTMKTTLLGMIGEPFRFQSATDRQGNRLKTIDDKFFQLKFSDAFKFSDGPDGLERAGNHVWFATINPAVFPEEKYRAFTAPRGSIEENDIRTWSGKSKASGHKHIQIPVIYLSLKRLVPIGEERKIKHDPIELSQKESKLYEKYHCKILLMSQEMQHAELVQSPNKATLGYATEDYDSLTNSAGQDNVGKILLAILSFQRLKDALGEDYKGGILLIDELDATLYPAAQKKLVETLLHFCNDLNLQVIFTTHSTDIVKYIAAEPYSKDCKIIYLQSKDNETIVHEDLPIERILAHLRAEVASNQSFKIKVFTEDEVARIFLKRLISSRYKDKLNIVDVSIGHGELNKLRKQLDDFRQGIIVFDGDIDANSAAYKANNTLSLPGKNESPESLFYNFLKKLPESDEFWDQIPGGYSKQICFEDYETVHSASKSNSGQVKEWFKRENDQKRFGRGCSKLINRWKKDNQEIANNFLNKFDEAYKAQGGK